MIWTTEVFDRRQGPSKTCICSPTRGLRFWVPKYITFYWWQVIFARGKTAGGKADHLPHPVTRVRMNGAENPPSFTYMACAGTYSSSSLLRWHYSPLRTLDSW